MPPPLPGARWALTPPFQPSPCMQRRSDLCGAFRRIAPPGRYPGTVASGSPDFPRTLRPAAIRPSAQAAPMLSNRSGQACASAAAMAQSCGVQRPARGRAEPQAHGLEQQIVGHVGIAESHRVGPKDCHVGPGAPGFDLLWPDREAAPGELRQSKRGPGSAFSARCHVGMSDSQPKKGRKYSRQPRREIVAQQAPLPSASMIWCGRRARRRHCPFPIPRSTEELTGPRGKPSQLRPAPDSQARLPVIRPRKRPSRLGPPRANPAQLCRKDFSERRGRNRARSGRGPERSDHGRCSRRTTSSVARIPSRADGSVIGAKGSRFSPFPGSSPKGCCGGGARASVEVALGG